MRAGWWAGIGVAALGCHASAPDPVPAAPRPAVRAAADSAAEEASMPVATAATPVVDLDRAVPARLTTATFALG